MDRKNQQITDSEMEIQNHYTQKVRLINEDKYEKTGKRPLMYAHTFGCQMNVHDSEKLIGVLKEMGYDETGMEKDADLIIYNTCCVRENAENKVYGNLGFLKPIKQKRPDLKIILCGCMMQQSAAVEKIKKTHRHVDIIFGTFNIHRLPQLLHTNIETGKPIIDIWQEHGDIVEDLPIIRESKYKASVNIMYGCNNFCSYCIVPYVRGRERSRAPKDITREIQALVKDGVIEITLLGQNVNSYGYNSTNNTSFAQLLREINAIDGLERIRFLTSHPKDLSDELILAMRDCDKVCKHIHLPIQSGSDVILEKMNRKYTKQHYLGLTQKIKQEIPNISITTDIIVGFPGEREEDFLETLDLMEKARFSGAFTFIYSKRTGTPAALMEEQVSDEVIKDRFNRLLAALKPTLNQLNKDSIGNTIKVMAEEINKQDDSLYSGRTDDNRLVHFKSGKSSVDIGKIYDVQINSCKTFYLVGEIID